LRLLLEETFLIAAFTLAGVITGAVILNRMTRSKTLLKKKEGLIKPYNTTKEELQSLQFEKSLILQSITRVYEASYEGKIDLIERDRLLLKYQQQLDSYDKKIADLQPVVDIAELADMRNGLVSLLEGRITAIDQKLADISNKYGISASDIILGSPKSDYQSIIDRVGGGMTKKKNKEKKNKDDTQKENDDEEGQHLDVTNEEIGVAAVVVREQIDQKKYSSKEKVKTKEGEEEEEEKTVDELQKEIMYALSRLEQMDSDDRYKDHEQAVNNKKRDALSSF
jgi:hypothetical protein